MRTVSQQNLSSNELLAISLGALLGVRAQEAFLGNKKECYVFCAEDIDKDRSEALDYTLRALALAKRISYNPKRVQYSINRRQLRKLKEFACVGITLP